MEKLVSVLMCVYNTPLEYLKEAVDSILNQTYTRIEMVVVDDCSTDASILDYLNDLDEKENKVTIIHNKNNLGLTKSLNIGIAVCKGDYIARMDSDDYSLPERILKQVEYMDEHPDVALVGSNIICFGDGISDIDMSQNNNPFDDPEIYRVRSLIQHSGPPHPTFMFRTSFLKVNGIQYREEIKKAQDYGIMADILRHGGVIKKIKESLLRYRIHDGQITANSSIEQKIYQCRVSYDYIKDAFSNLTDSECAAIALFGCNSYPWSVLIKTIENNSDLQRISTFITGNINDLNKPIPYISAVKKVLEINKETQAFREDVLEKIMRYELWKTALRRIKEVHKLSWLQPYILGCYFDIQMRMLRGRAEGDR